MTEKVKSFKNFLNESSKMDLPSPSEVKGLSVFKEIESIFPGIDLYGGGKQPLGIPDWGKLGGAFNKGFL